MKRELIFSPEYIEFEQSGHRPGIYCRAIFTGICTGGRFPKDSTEGSGKNAASDEPYQNKTKENRIRKF